MLTAEKVSVEEHTQMMAELGAVPEASLRTQHLALTRKWGWRRRRRS